MVWISSYLKEIEMVQLEKSKVDVYLEKGCHMHIPNDAFDALDWWKLNAYKFLILPTMARDILAIPITIVASEATVSVGSRVIDKYHFSLAPTTVEMLMCGGHWCSIWFRLPFPTAINEGLRVEIEPTITGDSPHCALVLPLRAIADRLLLALTTPAPRLFIIGTATAGSSFPSPSTDLHHDLILTQGGCDFCWQPDQA
ncbi:hypothetical protein ZIOFF_043239 [Zingiber officinale]|uniref:HAT C-terminal dimerisation domain-containing protein n=1 Tax=Zingiber officinale TaxID=94328 RepID=A0A8J5G340_ZINOF|nr:hypothetical protein ZIOFF_043239 [Zingiber officinale]